ncbi:hypothetical protein FVE85_7123 [Porphyridium purpureum]|uniref:FHA domain-containing protein n=1 Tax=Porphyridium purpureum TaxID=35688 RepID=A0A5J4Z8R1_PORPP|nr:hypothetical protein FVE85_7123 [Porphyridium purpureum]|eukprot:POR9745..scf295_1
MWYLEGAWRAGPDRARPVAGDGGSNAQEHPGEVPVKYFVLGPSGLPRSVGRSGCDINIARTTVSRSHASFKCFSRNEVGEPLAQILPSVPNTQSEHADQERQGAIEHRHHSVSHFALAMKDQSSYGTFYRVPGGQKNERAIRGSWTEVPENSIIFIGDRSSSADQWRVGRLPFRVYLPLCVPYAQRESLKSTCLYKGMEYVFCETGSPHTLLESPPKCTHMVLNMLTFEDLFHNSREALIACAQGIQLVQPSWVEEVCQMASKSCINIARATHASAAQQASDLPAEQSHAPKIEEQLQQLFAELLAIDFTEVTYERTVGQFGSKRVLTELLAGLEFNIDCFPASMSREAQSLEAALLHFGAARVQVQYTEGADNSTDLARRAVKVRFLSHAGAADDPWMQVSERILCASLVMKGREVLEESLRPVIARSDFAVESDAETDEPTSDRDHGSPAGVPGDGKIPMQRKDLSGAQEQDGRSHRLKFSQKVPFERSEPHNSVSLLNCDGPESRIDPLPSSPRVPAVSGKGWRQVIGKPVVSTPTNPVIYRPPGANDFQSESGVNWQAHHEQQQKRLRASFHLQKSVRFRQRDTHSHDRIPLDPFFEFSSKFSENLEGLRIQERAWRHHEQICRYVLHVWRHKLPHLALDDFAQFIEACHTFEHAHEHLPFTQLPFCKGTQPKSNNNVSDPLHHALLHLKVRQLSRTDATGGNCATRTTCPVPRNALRFSIRDLRQVLCRPRYRVPPACAGVRKRKVAHHAPRHLFVHPEISATRKRTT